MDFQGRKVIVTGGANGIGRCITETFISSGAFVAIIDTDTVSGNKLSEQYGERIFFYAGDIADKQTIDTFLQKVLARWQSVDYLINNACISRRGILSGCSYEDFNYVMRIGVTAPYEITRILFNHFSPEAAIVNISSTRAFMSQADTESYSATKGAITALTHALSISLAGKVRVNSISPGWIETADWQHDKNDIPRHSAADCAQHPVGRVGRPDDIAAMVLYLCSTNAGFITGQNFIIDGGMTRQMIYNQDCGWHFHPEK